MQQIIVSGVLGKCIGSRQCGAYMDLDLDNVDI